MDDDDEFLYGGSQNQSQSQSEPPQSQPEPEPEPTPVSQPIPQENAQVSNGVVSHLEAEAEKGEAPMAIEEEEEEEVVEDLEESDEDDIEIILEAPARSLDFRSNAPARPAPNKSVSSSQNAPAPGSTQPSPSLTTEYTPIQRGQAGPTPGLTSTPHPQESAPAPSTTPSQPPPQQQEQEEPDDGVDTSTLPPATAPPSHPSIDPTAVGTMDGRSILEFDLSNLADKPWRRPGSDISDWFNYGFDEISWEAYCYRRRDLGEMAHVLKGNVLNFSGMQEEQVNALPPEVRQMVMTGTNAMMNGMGGPPPGVMMDMSGMMPIGMDMGMNPMMMPEGAPGNGVVGAPDQSSGMMAPDGFNNGAPGMMGIGEFGMQDQTQMNQQMYQAVEAPQSSVTPTPGGPIAPRGSTPYRGRGVPPMPAAMGLRGRGFTGRGRGRGGYDGVPIVPPRPASPLPPGVPTGPRNQNKYKDRDNNAPAVDGLDYGGTRLSSGEPEDRGSRKRRASPNQDDLRSSKRR